MTFRFFQWNAGDVTECRDNLIHLVYVTKGKITINGGQIVDKFVVTENKFVLLAKGQKFKLTAEEYSEAVIQDVIYPSYVCEQRTFDITYAKHLETIKNTYKFDSLVIREPLLTTIRSIEFLVKDGVMCNHMIELKMKEIYLHYKHYYDTMELSQLFYPVLDKRMEFYIKVYAAAPRSHTVKELADLAGYSLSTFKIRFKSNFGETPYTWIINRKLKMLRMSLADESKPLKQIVGEFNFSDQSHLNNFCKRYMGGTALQVRNELLYE